MTSRFSRFKLLAAVATASFSLLAGSAHAITINPFPCGIDVVPGACQFDPILPGSIDGNTFVFTNPQSGRWFDPPYAVAFDISVAGGTVTKITAPVGFSGMQVLVGAMVVLDPFSAGDSYTFGAGVTSFRVANLLADMGTLAPFPLYMEFGGTPTSMTWTAQLAPVPEPAAAFLMLLGLAGVVAAVRTKPAA